MAFGIETSNKDGISLLDQASKQVQVGKSGSVVPGSFINSTSNTPFVDTPYAPAVVLPKKSSDMFLFIKPRVTTGSTTSFFPFAVAIYYGTTNLTITKKSGGASGSNVFYANLSTSTPVFTGNTTYLYTGKTSGITDASHLDVGIGEQIPGGSTYVSGSTNPYVTNLEADSTYDVKVTLDRNLTSTIPNNTTFVMAKDVAYFTRKYSEAWDSGWVLDYKFGTVTGNEEETGDYGFQVFASNGDLAFSSNRENFLIDSITSGDPDLGVSASGTSFGEANDESPIFAAEIGDATDWTEYWVMVSASGYSTQLCTGSNSQQRGTRSFGAGYIFCPPNNGDYANSTLTGNPFLTTSATLSKTSSAVNGVAMAPILTSFFDTVPGVSGGGFVNDAWAYDATRSLIIGHFV